MATLDRVLAQWDVNDQAVSARDHQNLGRLPRKAEERKRKGGTHGWAWPSSAAVRIGMALSLYRLRAGLP